MSDTAQSFSSLLECPICLGPFTDPRLLTGCFHTLCYKCLNDHIEQSGQGGRFQCPICRRYLEIPKGRADDFPRNYFANSCLDVLADSATGGIGPVVGAEQRKTKDKVCSNSVERDECAEAVQFCLVCCERYCQQCSKFHRRTTATSKHTQVALDELTDEMLNEALCNREIPTCPKHKAKSLELYCSTCQCAVCSICCHIDHQSHTFKEMKDVDEGLKAELDPLVIAVEVLKESVKCEIREVDKTTETYKKNASKARESVKGLFQQMQQMLSQKAAEIDQGICKKCDAVEALANSQSKNLVLNGQLLESLSSFAQNLQRKGTVFNRLANLPEVRLQVEKLKQSVADMHSAPETPSHTDLFAESVENLTIETDFPLDPGNPEEGRKITVRQTCNIPYENKTVAENDRSYNPDYAQDVYACRKKRNTETVQVDPGTEKLLLDYLNSELTEMRRSRRGFQVECNVTADYTNSAIEFYGNPESVKAAKDELQNLMQRMVCKKHPLSGQGMQKAFSGGRAEMFCLSMERKHHVALKIVEKPGATKTRPRGAVAIAGSGRRDAGGHETLVRNLPFKETRHQNVIRTQNIKVTLRKGSIENEQAVVVLNPLDRDLDLRKTATSKALLKAAGSQLEDEFQSNVQQSDGKPGSIIETKGWNLPSRAVYHGILVEWDAAGGQAKQVMRDLLRECFQTAENSRFPSIALPPAGTGKLGYPAEDVAQIMLEEIASFGSRQPLHLTEIHIIVHPKDTKKQEIFERVFRNAVGKNEHSNKGHGMQVNSDAPSSFTGGAGDDDENKFKVGSISLIIKTGDITKEKTDAIVNSSNPKLDLSRGAVQRAIARAGGDTVEKECREKTPRNGIAVTTAGKMKAKKIIHLAPSSKDRDDLLWPKMVKKALDEAERLGLKSVAFPAVGTGSGHQDVREIAKAMVGGVAYFENHTKPTSVKVVNFTIFQQEMVSAFKDAAKRSLKGGGRTDQTPIQNVGGGSGAPANNIELLIHAMSDDIIRDVEREIDQYAEQSKTTKERNDDLIKKLSDKQKRDIKTFARDRDVEVDIDTKSYGFGRNSVRMKGSPNDVMQVNDYVSNILMDIQKAKHEKETGKVMSKQVQWEFQDPNGPFKAYPDDVNLKIETAYQNKKPTVEWPKGSKRMKITFDDMEGEVVGDPANKVAVRRMEHGGIHPPANWTQMNSNEPFKLVPLAKTDQAYAAIVADFSKTMGSRTIKKIERVQNPIIYSRYMTHKKQLDKHNPPGTVNETFLWHGTNHTSAQNIISSGYNRSYCGQHGVAIGNGVYFATAASYSANNFSPANPQGEQCMFYSPVLTGVVTKGQGGLKEAPTRPADGSGFTRYDSVADNPSSPNMYVVFTDTAAYPGHLVTF